MNNNTYRRIMRKPEVIKQTGLSSSTLYQRISEGLFVKPISIGPRAVGFIEGEVNAVIEALIQGKSREEIKQLVIKLMSERCNY